MKKWQTFHWDLRMGSLQQYCRHLRTKSCSLSSLENLKSVWSRNISGTPASVSENDSNSASCSLRGRWETLRLIVVIWTRFLDTSLLPSESCPTLQLLLAIILVFVSWMILDYQFRQPRNFWWTPASLSYLFQTHGNALSLRSFLLPSFALRRRLSGSHHHQRDLTCPEWCLSAFHPTKWPLARDQFSGPSCRCRSCLSCCQDF